MSLSILTIPHRLSNKGLGVPIGTKLFAKILLGKIYNTKLFIIKTHVSSWHHRPSSGASLDGPSRISI